MYTAYLGCRGIPDIHCPEGGHLQKWGAIEIHYYLWLPIILQLKQ